MHQIAEWLEKLGLGQYVKLFAENDIDVSVLPHLSDEDLKDLGVSLGHRRKIFAAINKRTAPVQPSAEAERLAERRVQETPERRYVTVLFSDLVGSTALSTRLDPEDLREVIGLYQRCVEETVRRFDGFIAKFMGDGVLVYFGYPEAHEDDPERAVRAGLELVAAVKCLHTPEPLEARVGIATGLVIVGDIIGSGASQEQAIVGKTPNIAARLQGIAAPNMVVIADSTRKLLGNLFEVVDLGGKDLKGIGGPERAWAVQRPNPVDSRFDALHASGVTELIGRQEELDLLVRRWSKAIAGDGQVVLLSGEPGIGKSRLTAALLERLDTEPHTCLRYFCSPQHTDSALYPIINQMERAAGFRHGDMAQAKLDKLEALLAQSFTPPEDRALFADFLSLPTDGRYPKLELTPQQRRQRIFEALTTQIVALSEQHPVLMIFEDVHWIDPTSLEALGRGIDRIKSVGVLLIITHRPEFDPPWVGRPYVTALSLNRLGEHEIAAMIDRVTGNKALPESVRQDIIERTDGVPLFVEEMTKAVLEAESEGEAQRTTAAVPSPALAVPPSLHASLMARLDRLGAAKEVAQIGAAIGREFTHALLAAVVRKPEQEVEPVLGQIVRAGLLLRQGVPPHASYLFKHALIQDAAYGTLLREPRRALHARIAESLESGFPDIAENQPEILAHHFTEAGLIEKAASLWGKAGQRSAARSALVEAAAQFTRALDQIATLPATPALRREQIKLQVALITPLMYIKGYSAPETKVAAERARLMIEQAERLGEPPEDPLLLFSVLYGFWYANLVALNGDVACDLAAQFLALAEKQGATIPLMVGHRLVGSSSHYTGDMIRGRAHYDQALALYDPAKHRLLAARFGQDIRVMVLSLRSAVLWLLGYPDAALADVDRALRDAREIGHAPSLMYANWTVFTQILLGNYAAAKAQADELVALAEEKSAPFWKAFGGIVQGEVLARAGKASDAVHWITSGIAAYRSTGATLGIPAYLSYLITAYADLRQFDEALRCIDEASAAIEKTKERWFEAEINRIAGQVALMGPENDDVKAEAHFERALSVARQQQAKSWELRAAMSLARLWRSQGKVQQARELLAPAYGWFTEGFDTRDLKEAKALLEELA
jgi:class 3 adenylate cyclase/predicted ATPase